MSKDAIENQIQFRKMIKNKNNNQKYEDQI